MAKMTPEEIESHIETLEKQVSKFEDELEPMVAFFNAGRMMGRILFIVGGIITGIVSIWAGLSNWFSVHLK